MGLSHFISCKIQLTPSEWMPVPMNLENSVLLGHDMIWHAILGMSIGVASKKHLIYASMSPSAHRQIQNGIRSPIRLL